MARFEGRVSFVTGAGSGIGQATALRLASEGSTVICSDINEQSAQATAARAEELGATARALALDTGEEAAVEAALKQTASDFGRLDVLVNNAGVARKDWADTNAVNLSGVYYGLKYACPMMAEAGGGAVVNTASAAGLVALVRPDRVDGIPVEVERMSAYVATKHGVVGLTKQFAVTFAPVRVRVNAICPGYVATAMTAPMHEHRQGRAFLESLQPMARLGEPAEIAAAAAFLASDDASFVTGVAMPVDGGYTAR